MKTKEKGITLIALVVTIVVLLILAGVSISMLTGENGIINKAQEAKVNTEIAEEKEAIMIAYSGAKMKKAQSTIATTVNAEDLNTEFSINGISAGAVDNLDGTITVTFNETQRKYTIDSNGNLIESTQNEEDDDTEVLIGKKSLWFGDSIMRGYGNNSQGFPEYFQKLTGVECLNASFSGSTISDNTSEAAGMQDPLTIKEQIEYALSRTDVVTPSEIDFIVLDGGGNDVMIYDLGLLDKKYQKEIGTASDLSSDTVINDFREVISMLKENFPNAEILFIQPIAIDKTAYELIACKAYFQDNTLEDINAYYGSNCATMQEVRELAVQVISEIKTAVDSMSLRSDQLYKEIQLVCNELGIEYASFSDVVAEHRNTDGSDTNPYIQEDQKHFTDTAYTNITSLIIEKVKSMF